MRHRIRIDYCRQCGWLLRASWMAQELLTTFSEEIDELTLCPGSGGVFQIHVDGQRIWCRAEQGGFPEISPLKLRVRDIIAPERDLGHHERGRRGEAREGDA